MEKVFYIVDGNIKGEYENVTNEHTSDQDRERRLNNWLMDLGW